MKKTLRGFFAHIDWWLVASVLPILVAGWFTMNSFTAENYFAERQLLWIAVSFAVFFVAAQVDWRFLKRPWVLFGLYCLVVTLLLMLFVAESVRGIQAWFLLGGVAIGPSDLASLLSIILLAKYFSRRHVEIANIRHVFVSGVYVFVPFLLIVLQPNFGSAMILAFIWFGMVLVSGIPKRYVLFLFGLGTCTFLIMWTLVFRPYQKERILTFVDPLRDVRGTGYNALQSQIAVGSGRLWGKGVGHGTQSRLKFLPEYQTDFIFAAFAEEWGYVGVLILLLCYGVLIGRILIISTRGATNFEMLFGMGLAIYFISHILVNIGMNVGLLPVTGITLPFMSYGGSHLLTEFMGLGILMSMRRYARATHRDNMKNEFFGT
ncbi:MAG: rod shape-determining protein RodA [Candidatus Vogelbacteria bacterium CG10_big_fil_rev_8_21_14_0_10_51_16]|uniref:Rod shape-determining protein RodA n=1 Tax=Candidatus Vogelbacteria bacterium CG10_big_fil_rev_8_21_14_0_10_51_16 TaxID=1975045 RepID=A0A2H0RF27_9BACT|nr:MAG: rod shape-determining protein RodA [Candidatus Vogelbacteria bacterium CG10_big_fil_rev_8_21_14_0_10_51_16]